MIIMYVINVTIIYSQPPPTEVLEQSLAVFSNYEKDPIYEDIPKCPRKIPKDDIEDFNRALERASQYNLYPSKINRSNDGFFE